MSTATVTARIKLYFRSLGDIVTDGIELSEEIVIP